MRILSVCIFLCCLTSLSAQRKSGKSNSDTVKITNMGKAINSAFADYAPMISADGQMMLFTSTRPVTEKEIKKSKAGFEYVYSSSYDEKKKKWSDARPMDEAINRQDFNNSVKVLSGDGQKAILYRDDDNGNGDLYESHLDGAVWALPVKLPEPVNTKDHESSASFSPDGRTLYFISNRKGGKGNRDIWMCKQDIHGLWGAAENLGSVINTVEDEETVFMNTDGKTLYFSSKGHKGAGGYDIFRSVNDNGRWSEPENMATINTPEDDIYFILAASGQVGFYTSAKAGGMGGRDIYEVRFTGPKPKKETPQLTLLKGTITDETTGTPLAATLEIIDNVKNSVISTVSSNSSTGKYLVSLPSGKNYGIVVKAKEYLFYSVNVDIPFSAGYQEVIKDIQLKKLEVGKSIVLNNIFYDFDKATLRPESMAELDHLVQLMNENASVTIEISSHTDNKGSDDYNQKLSQTRAQSVVDFLISKGILTGRLVAKGYGEAVPVADNESEEGRQQNRRTEFKILAK